MTVAEQMALLGSQAKQAARELARLTTEQRNGCLQAMAAALLAGRDLLKRANDLDMSVAAQSGLSSAMLDRLMTWTLRILGELPPDAAERVAHRNATALFRLE